MQRQHLPFCEQLVQAGRELLGSGLTVETWGNISCRDPATGNVYLTPSAMAYDRCTAADMVVFAADGTQIDGRRRPSVEAAMHLSIYRARGDVQAILHTHPVYSTVFGCLGEKIPPIIDEAAQALGGPVPVTAYALPGSEQLARNCVDALGALGMACLLRSHGAVCCGADMAGAFKTARVLEMTAQIYYMARTIGTPEVLPRDKVDWMRDFALNRYRQ
ncbi:class II aldolase/adducin family protein [Neobittarella massiliensis]|uniref:class II aldolase/adducin family protein n=1 Tax=Neobittarella massiliensis (ex Bilen et al. 2018) TaxID=2041842 RepID=UPI000CF6C196|nr:class II aldolase/adducin family protein [Neobittarella massiliensis]